MKQLMGRSAIAGLALVCFLMCVGAADASSWVPAGSMTSSRELHTATLLATGDVLVAGGWLAPGGPALKSAELFDPSTDSWTPTGSMGVPRVGAIATGLHDGDVLVAGGNSGGNSSTYTSDAELYDPTTGTWKESDPMLAAQVGGTATLLLDGEVFAFNGWEPVGPASPELYDPQTGQWRAAATPPCYTVDGTATLLGDGSVLVQGNWGLTGCSMRYFPGTNSWQTTSEMNHPDRLAAVAAPLANGSAVIAGGVAGTLTASSEVYDPAADAWRQVGDLTTALWVSTAVLLNTGHVLMDGGVTSGPLNKAVAGADLYDDSSQAWSQTAPMSVPRTANTTTLLKDGSALVAGGGNNRGTVYSSAERYIPGPDPTLTAPIDGSTTVDAQPSFSGTAGVLSDDVRSVTVRVYAGSNTSGPIIQTLTAAVQPDGSYSIQSSTPLADGIYTAQARQHDNSGNVGFGRASTFTVSTAVRTVQTITFISSPSAKPVYGGSYTVATVGGSSGNPVTFSIDSSSGPGACSVSGSTVWFTGVGVCVIDANQAGNANYNRAPEVRQQLTIGKAPLTVTPDNRTKLFGAPVPMLTWKISGFVSGETLATSGVSGAPSCTTAPTVAGPGGTYPITCTVGSLSSNHYGFRFVAGTLTVTYSSTRTGTYLGRSTILAGQAVLLAGATVIGPLTVQPRGALDVQGAAIAGPFRASGAAAVRVCGATITGPVTITGSTGQITFGDQGGSCAGNKTVGPEGITGNAGGVAFWHNQVTGPLTITPNNPAVDSGDNSVSGPIR